MQEYVIHWPHPSSFCGIGAERATQVCVVDHGGISGPEYEEKAVRLSYSKPVFHSARWRVAGPSNQPL
jgi:hypothetical protein